MSKKSKKSSVTKTDSVGPNHDAKPPYKNGVKQPRSSGDIFCRKIEQSDWSREILGQNKRIRFSPIILFPQITRKPLPFSYIRDKSADQQSRFLLKF